MQVQRNKNLNVKKRVSKWGGGRVIFRENIHPLKTIDLQGIFEHILYPCLTFLDLYTLKQNV